MNKNCNSAPAERKQSGCYAPFKRALDLIFAALALVFAAVPMLAISLCIRLELGESAIFTQQRVGRGGKPFNCYKFRTMKKEAPHSCSKKELENADAYITRTGRILRKTSLDELPQLFNILRGDMSFIGPRPLIPEETLVHELRTEAGVYSLRPGISGYAQINGRDMIPDERKAALDKDYLEHFGFVMDMKIVFGTVLSVLSEKDIHQGALEETPQDQKQ